MSKKSMGRNPNKNTIHYTGLRGRSMLWNDLEESPICKDLELGDLGKRFKESKL